MRIHLFLSAVLLCAGCSTIYTGATNLYTDYLGSRRWLLKARLPNGKVEEVVERTQESGTLRGRFEGLDKCVQVIYSMPVEKTFYKVRCEVVLPETWNGNMVVLGTEGPGGDFPRIAPKLAMDGSAVVSCDGGMNFFRNRDGSPNPVRSGAKREDIRKIFMQTALHLAIQGGRELVTAYYGKPLAKTIFKGRETGGSQGIFLAERYPADIDELDLVNPAIDFWSTLAYEVNVSSHVREITGQMILKNSQCDAVVAAVKGVKEPEKLKEQEFFERASKIDPVFTFAHTQEKICRMWHELYTAETISSNLNVHVESIPLGVDLKPVIRSNPWRVQWFFGETELGHSVEPAKLLAAREACAALTPQGDLAAFAAHGGTLTVILEKNNPFVPYPLVEADLKKIKGLQPTVKRVDTFTAF